mgnify:CR=1 FL=1
MIIDTITASRKQGIHLDNASQYTGLSDIYKSLKTNKIFIFP